MHDTESINATGRRFINLVSMSKQAVDFTSDDHFHDDLKAHVNVSQVKVKNGHRAINYKLLAEKWLVLADEQTTQQGGWMISHPSLAHWFRTNDRQL